jgi:hypothetical protein
MTAVVLGGCVTQMPAPTVDADSVVSLRGANLAAANTAEFKLAPGKDASMDTSIAFRASSLAPDSGSFSKQLKLQIEEDLKAAGLYDPKSDIVIEGQLTDSESDTGMGTATAKLSAHFTVTRHGEKVFDKELSVDDSWESSFIGGVAIPRARQHYMALYPKLAGKLLMDPQFRVALARR